MAEPTMKILHGPPGTGKTWRAGRDAVRVLEPRVDEDDIEERHRALVDAGRIIWVTFHPSYTYEDFVEGLRPVVEDVGVTYEPKPGPFLRACETARRGVPFTVGETIASTTGDEYRVVEAAPDSVILEKTRGRGTGMRYPVSLWLIRELQDAGHAPEAASQPGEAQEEKTRIADSVNVPKTTIFSTTGDLRAAWERLEEWRDDGDPMPVVLVIDEMNRADLSRVFGELMTLLEPDKREGASQERSVVLPYSGDRLTVPSQVSVIGTMNTADRSLAVMDLALRRRFEFEEMVPDPTLCAEGYAGVDLPGVLERWNHRITGLLSREHRIGHSYLMEAQLERRRGLEGFADDEDGRLRAVAQVVRRKILPLLAEYFHDDWRKIDLVFGRDFEREEGGLLEELRFRDLDRAAHDVVDLTETTSYEPLGFWDPLDVDNWDADRFRQALTADGD